MAVVQSVRSPGVVAAPSSGVSLALRVLEVHLALTALAALAVRYPLAAGVPLCVVAPAWILATGGTEGFAKLKLATLIVGRALVPAAVLGLVPGAFAAKVVLWLYRINIAEAVGADARSRNIGNALGGLAVLAATAFLEIRWLGTYYAVGPGPFLLSAIAYTIWNLNFVALNFSGAMAMLHVATLAAPLVGAGLANDGGLWLILRAASLTISVWGMGASKAHAEDFFAHPGHARWQAIHRRPVVQGAIGAATIGCAVAGVLVAR